MTRVVVASIAALAGGLIGFFLPFFLYISVSWKFVEIITLITMPLIMGYSLISGFGAMCLVGTLVWDQFDKAEITDRERSRRNRKQL